MKPNSLKDGLSNDSSSSLSQPSYSEKYKNSRKTSIKNVDPSDSSNIVTSYAQLYKSKINKSQSATTPSSKSVKGAGLNPLQVNRTNGYSLAYKKGTLGGRHDYSKGNIDANNNANKLLGRNNSMEVKSLSCFDSQLAKSPSEKNKQQLFGVNPNLSASLPDWSQRPSRSRKLLSPVSPSKFHCKRSVVI